MNKKFIFQLSIMIGIFPVSLLADNKSFVHDYTDVVTNKQRNQLPQGYLDYKQKLNSNFQIEGSIAEAYSKAAYKIDVPGYISTSPAPPVGVIVGPNASENFLFQIGDNVFIRWKGISNPKVGDVYSICTPMLVYQNLGNPTDFQVLSEYDGEELRSSPANYRLAGYLYESKGDLKITSISQGLVSAVIQGLRSTIKVNDRLMRKLPSYSKVNPIVGGIQLAAAVVSGSPFNRISSNERTYVYINRGARDGMKVGRMFEAVEGVRLSTDSVANPEVSLGEAMIVHVSDSYSTAIITKQFDVIRIGALLKTKQELAELLPKKPFPTKQAPADVKRELEVPEPGKDNNDLPPQAMQNEPTEKSPTPLSDLDQIEKSVKVPALSAGEKTNLDKLVTQESKKELYADPVETENGALIAPPEESDNSDSNLAPELPKSQNSFDSAAAAKKDPRKKKKAKKSNDEEELNQLMMQN